MHQRSAVTGVVGLRWRPVALVLAGVLCASGMLPTLASATVEAPHHAHPSPPSRHRPGHLVVRRDAGHDESAPLSSIVPAAVGQSGATNRSVPPPLRHLTPTRSNSARHGRDPLLETASPGLRRTATAAAGIVAPTPGVGFPGVSNADNGATAVWPPDTEGAVGLQYYVQWVNVSFAVYDKATGALVYGPVLGNTLWSNFPAAGGVCQTSNQGDPIVKYDALANRWLFAQLTYSGNGTGPGYECMAVSATSNPLGQYYRYAFEISPTDFGDYPKISVWPDAYYLTVNQFNGSTYDGPAVFALQRSAMLSGQPAVSVEASLPTTYFSLLPADLDGTTPPPSTPTGGVLSPTPEYLASVATSSTSDKSIYLWTFDVDTTWATSGNKSTFSGPVTLTTAPYAPDYCVSGGALTTACVPQEGTKNVLDSLGDRVMYRLAYRNFGSYQSLVLNDTVNVSATGNQGEIGWYEVRNPSMPLGPLQNNESTDCGTGGTQYVCIYQQGTFGGVSGQSSPPFPSDAQRFMGSIAMDHVGDIGLGYSVSSSSMYPSIGYSGQTVGSTLGQMNVAETEMKAGGGYQNGSRSNQPYRWGDYSSLETDPANDCVFWYTNEYYTAADTNSLYWSTWIGSFSFPGCTTPEVALSPSSVSFGDLQQQASVTKPVTISNPGSAPLDVSDVALAGPQSADFSFTSPGNSTGGPFSAFTIAPNSSATVDVTLTAPASAVGDVSATLEATTNGSAAVQDVGLSGAVVAPPGTIAGSVTSGGSGLPGICVTAYETSDRYAGSTQTNSSGAYSLGEEPGQYRLRFSPCNASGASYGTQWWTSSGATNDFSTAGDVAVSSSAQTTANMTLSAAGSITGTVTSASTAGTLENICVSAYTSGRSAAGSAVTGTLGTYTLGGLAPGSYDVRFSDCSGSGYATMWYSATGAVAGVSQATAVTVASGLSSPASVVLNLAGSVSGTVTSPTTGIPVSGICVGAFAAGGGYIDSTTTNSSGSYSIASLPPGSGTVKLRYSDCTGTGTWATAWDGSSGGLAVDFTAAVAISVTSGGTTSEGTTVLEAAGFVSGTVTAASGGATIPNVCVLAYSSNDDFIAITTTSSTGAYTLGGLPAGTLQLYFEPCGTAVAYNPQWYGGSSTFPGTGVAVSSGTTTANIDAQLS